MQTITSAPRRAAPRPVTVLQTDQPRVVLAEDDFEMRRLVAQALRRDGYEVLEAKNGSELIECLETALRVQDRIDLVITDVRMPGLSGLQAIDWMNKVRALQVPVLVVTAFCDRHVRQQARRLGAEVLEKPFDLEELRARIRKLPHAST
jgi:DNA-binding response OmpR family regulator